MREKRLFPVLVLLAVVPAVAVASGCVVRARTQPVVVTTTPQPPPPTVVVATTPQPPPPVVVAATPAQPPPPLPPEIGRAHV